jgi:hypothetical protein
MLKYILSPSFLIPFALVTPYLFIGLVGITWFEILLTTTFIAIVTKKRLFPRKPIIIIFAVLLFSGYFIAVFNADFNFNIPFKFRDLKIFYWLLLAFSGFYFGYRNYQDIVKIGQSRTFKSTMIVLGLFAGGYPFLSDEIRALVMRLYSNPDIPINSIGRIYTSRFPGLGVNANIYGFMLLIMYYIALKSAFEKKISWIFPLISLICLVTNGSKTIFFLALVLSANIFYFSPISLSKKIKIIANVVLVLSALIFFLFTSDLSSNYVLIPKVISLTKWGGVKANPIEDRISLWKMGMARVELSPFAGITKSPTPSDYYVVHFSNPHNEFIAYWTFTGFLGLAAFVILLVGLIIQNRRSKQAHFWIGLYLALCFQMLFDAAFQATRFIPLIFLLIGLNLRELDIQRALRRAIFRSG